MVTLGVRVINAGGYAEMERKVRRRLVDRVGRAMVWGQNEWRKTVIASTWFRKEPASTDSIICEWKSVARGAKRQGWTFKYGWINYKGSAARAQWRLSLREWQFTPKLMDRVEKALKGRAGGG